MKDSRDSTILRALRSTGSATVAELARAAGASEVTLRRDLTRLDRAGALRRTHGGAVLADADAPFLEVAQVNRHAKEAIAAAAAATVVDGQTVILDIGTTVLPVAFNLRGRDVTVVTGSLAVFEALADDRAVQLILLGGTYSADYRSVGGFLTVESLRQLHADQAFLGVSGVAENGDLRDTTMVQVPVKRAICEASDRVTVLADSSKLPGIGAGRIQTAGAVHHMITDAPPPALTAEALIAAGVDVTVV